MNNTITIGCDPGITGAIAVLRDGEYLDVHDAPTMLKGKSKRQINPAEVARILSLHDGAVVYMERVSAMPKQGVSSTFTFGESFGVVRGVVAALAMPLELVTPQTWMKRYGLPSKKTSPDAARTKAIELFPQAPLGRKKDAGRADALLIARYGYEVEQSRVSA